MKNSLRLTAALVALSVFSLTAHAAAPGYVDIGKFKPADGCQFVEVNVHAPLLKFASAFVDKEEPEVAELIRAIKHVRVNVVGFNEKTREETTNRVEGVRHELSAQGWTEMVTVKQAEDAENVAIFVKMTDNDSIEGLVVTVIDTNKKEVVFVNLVGNINPEQLATIGKRLNIDPLAHLTVKLNKKSV
ncbi:MAG TPA: DUF4252 domain-containing protein [Longimicrobiales bacterium]|nr:DUF4252 domain-containing protein [Longimicrobiales bacterium]